MNTTVIKPEARSSELEHTIAKHLNFGAKARVRLYGRYERYTARGFDFKRATGKMHARYHRDKDARRAVFRRIADQLQDGRAFSDAIAPYVPPAERLLIAAGEQTSRASDAFRSAAFIASAVQRMQSTVISAMVYPSVLMLMLCLMLAGITFLFVPTMLDMAPIESWPPISKVVYNLAQMVTHGGPWIVGIGIILAIVTIKTLPTFNNSFRGFLDRYVPPWTIYREYQGSTFLISLAALVEAGRPVDAAIKQMNLIATRWMKWHLRRMIHALQEGTQPGRAIDTGLLHKETVGDIEDYADAGAFDSAIGAMGRDAIEDSIERIKGASAVITALCLVAVAGTLVLVYLGMIFLVMDVAQKAQLPR